MSATKPLVFDRPHRGRIYDSIAETIGNTPLVRIPRIAAEEGITADICLKLEFFNPIASVKDRIGVNMILALEAELGRPLAELRRSWMDAKRLAAARVPLVPPVPCEGHTGRGAGPVPGSDRLDAPS